MLSRRIVADVTDAQPVDREQVEADFWFSSLRGRLRMEIEWADSADVSIPYRLDNAAYIALGMVRDCTGKWWAQHELEW